MSIIDINPDNYSEQLYSHQNVDSDQLVQLGALLNLPKYYTKQIGIDRGIFHHWNRKELMFFKKEKDKGWQKFSFVECVWLLVIRDLRVLGISLDYIKLVRDAIYQYSINVIKGQLLLAVDTELLAEDREEERGLLEQLRKTYAAMSLEEVKNKIEDSRQSAFFGVVLNCLCTKQNHFITITKTGIVGLHQEREEEMLTGENLVIKTPDFKAQSFVQINIWNIICELLQLPAVSLPAPVLENSLSYEEQRILSFIRDEAINEIKIEKGLDGKPTIIRATKNIITPKVVSKLYPFLKKGCFTDWSFASRDGKLVKFKETEVINLKKEVQK